MNECIDKNSVLYFMSYMTQKEFEERISDKHIVKNYKFNRIQPERLSEKTLNEGSDSLNSTVT